MRKITAFLVFIALTQPAISSADKRYFPFPETGVLTEAMTKFYDDNGYVVLTDYIPQERCSLLYEQAMQIAKALNPTPDELKQQFDHPTQYLLQTASALVPLFYPEAYVDGKLVVAAADAVYAMGNNAGACNDSLRELTLNNLNRTICNSLGYTDPQLNQSQINYKSQRYSRPFLAHQDQMFSPTLTQSLCTFIIPFVQTTMENGCWWVVPGSHKFGPYMRYLRMADDSFAYVGEKERVLTTDEVTKLRQEWQAKLSTPLAAPAGSLTIIHGCLIHGSFKLKGAMQENRVVYTFSVTENGDQDPRIWNYNPDYPLIKGDGKI